MKTIFAVLILSASALAQTTPTSPPPLAPSCGPPNVNFNVLVDYSQHTLQPPDPGMARVYFIKDDGTEGDSQHYVLKFGMDGEWIGAFKPNSYITVSVKPGVHHICVNVQSKFSIGSLIALAHFNAKVGKTYYFRTQYLNGVTTVARVPDYVSLDPLDSDEAKYLIAYYPLSVAQVKK